MKRLFRSEQNKKIAGVCGGIGEFFDIDPTLIRLVFIFLGLATGLIPFIIGYFIAWWIVPTKSEIEK
jgi:phage shock protein C